jgi:hypothetical protein
LLGGGIAKEGNPTAANARRYGYVGIKLIFPLIGPTHLCAWVFFMVFWAQIRRKSKKQ